VGELGHRFQPRLHGRQWDVDATGHDNLVGTPDDLEPAVVVKPAEVGGVQPSVSQHGRGNLRLVDVPVEEYGSRNPDLACRPQRHSDAVEGHPVVHAASTGLAHAVGRDNRDAQPASLVQQRRTRRSAAEQDGVVVAERGDVVVAGQPAVQLRRHGGEVAAVAGQRASCRGEVEMFSQYDG